MYDRPVSGMDVIFVSSENVFPSEVENRLEEHDAVVESCVAGIDDPVTGQAVKAFVVRDGTGAVDEAGLTEWCRGGLPAYKVPTSWEIRTEPLPPLTLPGPDGMPLTPVSGASWAMVGCGAAKSRTKARNSHADAIRLRGERGDGAGFIVFD